MALPDWSAIRDLKPDPLTQLFADDDARLAMLSADVSGIHFDWSKTHLTREALTAFAALAESMGLAAKRDALFAGEAVNVVGRARPVFLPVGLPVGQRQRPRPSRLPVV